MLSTIETAHALLPIVRTIVEEAGAIASRSFRLGERTSAQVWYKAGGSPVTEADVAVDAFLKEALAGALPGAGWLSEETIDDPARLDQDLVWIVDPIDGTRAFLSGHPDWSVAVALLHRGRPVLGFVHAPAHQAFYEAVAGGGARRDQRPIEVASRTDLVEASIAGPKPLVDQVERRVGVLRVVDKIPSLALRIARVAEGAVEVGLVSGNARDWDLAAADLILAEAGGRLTGTDGVEPLYNRPEPVHGELVAASQALHGLVLEALATPSRSAARR